MLDLIGKALFQNGIQYERIDGRTTLNGRRAALKTFQCDPVCTVLLATVGSVGEG
jgi:SNF2 family DNA or RNA helicase